MESGYSWWQFEKCDRCGVDKERPRRVADIVRGVKAVLCVDCLADWEKYEISSETFIEMNVRLARRAAATELGDGDLIESLQREAMAYEVELGNEAATWLAEPFTRTSEPANA